MRRDVRGINLTQTVPQDTKAVAVQISLLHSTELSIQFGKSSIYTVIGGIVGVGRSIYSFYGRR